MTPERPRLAIIINCYNYENYVRHSIESVVSQDTTHCDVIVIDDGSTDRSWDEIEKFGLRSFRKENGGQVSACRYGVSKTDAPFVLFLDADDELMPGAIQKIILHLDEGVAKLQFPLLRIDSTGSVIGPAFPKLADARDRGLFVDAIEKAGTYITPPTSGNVFRRDLCTLLDDAHYDSAVDGIMLLAAPFYGDVVSLSEPLGRYRLHNRNKSGSNRVPAPTLLRRHQKRFVDRLSHLRTILIEKDGKCNIGNSTEMYMYSRYRNYIDIIEFRRITWRSAIVTATSFPSWYNPIKRLSVVVFLLACLVLPLSTIRSLLEARLTRTWRPVVSNIRTLGMARSG
ncbi:glycosyltransferase family 2 protein [Methylobacterium sp. J-072]|uniref:glycosyltransferase family 2 protein n=1 Tax=Methylobacterium sp. J-072 TaxID=2836651 RepID=UPI001FBAA3E0|nr:glycosyltransferase family 2 protein [Methylobacterium sp. J-072]MCJ2094506.1 glycosyltransferase family 2 protein [Methylobacterium sp. J-072]